MLDYSKESEDSFGKSDDVVGKGKHRTPIEVDMAGFNRTDNTKAVSTVKMLSKSARSPSE